MDRKLDIDPDIGQEKQTTTMDHQVDLDHQHQFVSFLDVMCFFKLCACWCAFKVQYSDFNTKDLYHKNVVLPRQKVLLLNLFFCQNKNMKKKENHNFFFSE